MVNRIASMEPPPRKMTINGPGTARAGQTIIPADHTNDQIVMANGSGNNGGY